MIENKKFNEPPTQAQIAELREALNTAAKEFWAAHGDNYDFVMLGPPGPRPPPKMDLKFLNLSSF
jgi:hypothetical protein